MPRAGGGLLPATVAEPVAEIHRLRGAELRGPNRALHHLTSGSLDRLDR